MTLVKINNKQSTIINQNTPLLHRISTRLVTSVATLQPAFAHRLKLFQKIQKNSKKPPSRPKNPHFQQEIGTPFAGKSTRNQKPFLRKQSQS